MTFPAPYRARPARRDDLHALIELHEARDLADVGFVDQAREEILVDWAAPRFEFDRDTVVAEASDGRSPPMASCSRSIRRGRSSASARCIQATLRRDSELRCST